MCSLFNVPPPPGGIWKAVESCTEMGGCSFALFLGSQRSWKRPALDPKAAAKFQEQCSLQEFDPAHILPHGSYLMNCGSPKEGLLRRWWIMSLTFLPQWLTPVISSSHLSSDNLLWFVYHVAPRCVWEEPGHAGGWAQPLQPPGSKPLQLSPWFLPGLHHHWAVYGQDSRSH